MLWLDLCALCDGMRVSAVLATVLVHARAVQSFLLGVRGATCSLVDHMVAALVAGVAAAAGMTHSAHSHLFTCLHGAALFVSRSELCVRQRMETQHRLTVLRIPPPARASRPLLVERQPVLLWPGRRATSKAVGRGTRVAAQALLCCGGCLICVAGVRTKRPALHVVLLHAGCETACGHEAAGTAQPARQQHVQRLEALQAPSVVVDCCRLAQPAAACAWCCAAGRHAHTWR